MPNTVEIEDPQSVVRYLRLTEYHWQKVQVNGPHGNWVFRGQGNAEWPLLPKLHRKVKDQNTKGFPDKITSQEFYKVQDFVNLADSYGLIKGRELDLKDYREAIIKRHRGELDIFPALCGGAQEALMLAQHHGIATRLLDWSASPMIALYFAAESIVKDENSSTHFAVWGLQREHCMRDRISVIPAIRSQNSNALSQQGHFTIDLEADENFEANGWWQSHDSIIDEKWYSHENRLPESYHHLKKIVVPKESALEILWLLSMENITKVHIMPSLDNVTETLNVRVRYNDVRMMRVREAIDDLNAEINYSREND